MTVPRTEYLIEPKGSNFTDAKRVIAVAFSYDKDGNISYGASIFHREDPTQSNDTFKKSTIRETSLARFTTSPIRIKMSDVNIKNIRITRPGKQNKPQPSDDTITHRRNEALPQYDDVLKTIRKAMYTRGVKDRHITA